MAELLVTAGGLVAIAALAWFFFAPRAARRSELGESVQEVEVVVSGGYSPNLIEAREGVPLRVTFDRRESGECTSRVLFPEFGVNAALPAHARTTVELLPDHSGRFEFACGMNMVHGTLVVVPGENGEGHDKSDGVAAIAARPADERSAEASVDLEIRGMHCASCVRTVERALAEVPGVEEASVSFGVERASVTYDPDRVELPELLRAVSDRGYEARERGVVNREGAIDAEEAERGAELRDLGRRVSLGALLTLPVVVATMASEVFDASWVPAALTDHWVQLVLIAPVFLYVGWPIHVIGWRALRHRSAEMNTLIAIGTMAAFGYSLLVTLAPSWFPTDVREVYFEAVGVIITLILLGRLLEARARAGTGEAIRKLIGLRPRTARVDARRQRGRAAGRRGAPPATWSSSGPARGSPVDGEVVDGSSTIDESMITGESLPVSKVAGEPVIGATVNQTGSLRFRASAVGEDTVLAQIIRLVERGPGLEGTDPADRRPDLRVLRPGRDRDRDRDLRRSGSTSARSPS